MHRRTGHSGARGPFCGLLPAPAGALPGPRRPGLLRAVLAALLVALLLALPQVPRGQGPGPGDRHARLDLVPAESVALRPETPEVQLRLPPVILPGAPDWRIPAARRRRLGRRAGPCLPALRRQARCRIRAPPLAVT
jgi:hypothetical protein